MTSRRLCVLLLISWPLTWTLSPAWAATYTWTAGGGNDTNWTTAANWGGSGYPQTGDTALFNLTGARTVGIALGNQAADTVNVTGSGSWTWGGNTLTFASGFNYSNTAANGSCYAPLAGNGALTISAGRLDLYGTNTLTGGIFVRSGALGLVNGADSALGAAGSSVTLGSKGKFGALLKVGTDIDIPVSHPITLAGTGGQLGTTAAGQWQTITVAGNITGPGRLVIGALRGANLANTTDNGFSGGTAIQNGDYALVVTSSSNSFGTGNITIELGSKLQLASSNNVSRTAAVRLRSVLGLDSVLDLDSDFVPPAITPDSTGIIAFFGTSGANINALFASNAPTLGNGRVSLSGWGSGGYFTGASLKPSPDGVYRIRAVSGALRLDAPGAQGVLTGTNAVELEGNYIQFIDDYNDFSGPLSIKAGAQVVAYCPPSPGPSTLGDTNGAVVLNRCSFARLLELHSGGGTYTNPIVKGPLTFNSSSLIHLVSDTGVPVNFIVASLTRSEHGTLKLEGDGKLGGLGRFSVGNGAPMPDNGIVSPCFVDAGWLDAGMDFVSYANGAFTTATYTAATLAGAGSADIVNLGASEAVPAGGKEVYALKTAYAVTGTDTLTNGSGGLILTRSDITHTAPMSFNEEAFIWTIGRNTLNGKISGSGGLVKAGWGNGAGLLYLGSTSNDFNGLVTVNEGELYIAGDGSLGNATNKVYLNNGGLMPGGAGGGSAALGLYANSVATAREIILGSNGGGLSCEGYNWTLNGKITGAGPLWFTGWATAYVSNSSNDYTGGTIISGGAVQVGPSGKLGTGDVTVVPFVGSASLQLNGEGNVAPTARIVLRQDPVAIGTAAAQLQGPTQTIAAIEGNGAVTLGTSGSATELKVGGNNDSFEFYGDIGEANPSYPGALIKEGAGVFTLWGVNSCSGTTTVTNGTLIVNGTQGSRTEVGGRGLLAGIGLIANDVQIQSGGKLAPGFQGRGSLQVNGTVSFDAGSTYEVTLRGTNATSDFAQLSVNGALNLGGALNVVLTSAPAVGQQFMIMDNLSGTTVNGAFASGHVASAVLGDKTYFFGINYHAGDGNDVQLTALRAGTLISVR